MSPYLIETEDLLGFSRNKSSGTFARYWESLASVECVVAWRWRADFEDALFWQHALLPADHLHVP